VLMIIAHLQTMNRSCTVHDLQRRLPEIKYLSSVLVHLENIRRIRFDQGNFRINNIAAFL
jgi:hypothetical protein